MSIKSALDEKIDEAYGVALERSYEFLQEKEESDPPIKGLYEDTTVARVQDSFVRGTDGGREVLYVDLTEASDLVQFASEIEQPSPLAAAINLIQDEEISKHSYDFQAEGFVDGLYELFDASDADYTMFHTDNIDYFAPQEPGVATTEALSIAAREGNISRDLKSKGRIYTRRNLWDEDDERRWRDWSNRRPNPDTYEKMAQEQN